MNPKSRETVLRRVALRRGYRLVKAKVRDPQAVDWGLYALLDIRHGGAVNPSIAGQWVCSWTLDQVEEFLAGAGRRELTEPDLEGATNDG